MWPLLPRAYCMSRLEALSLNPVKSLLRGEESESEGRSVVSNSLQLHGLYSPWNSPGQNTEVGSLYPSPGDLPNPGIEPRSPTLQVDSFPAEPSWKPRNTGVGSLSLLQQIFPTQELNWGLLHCSRILYQLSYQGSSTHLKTKVVCAFSCFLFLCG